MCGISGIIDKRGAPVGEAWIRWITDLVAHWDPDDLGFHSGPGVALGHRRLSIHHLDRIMDGVLCTKQRENEENVLDYIP